MGNYPYVPPPDNLKGADKIPGWLLAILTFIGFIGTVWLIRVVLYFAFGYLGFSSGHLEGPP